MINGQPVRVPLEPVVRFAAIALAVVIAGATGLGMASDWSTLALYWYGAPAALGAASQAASVVDPIFARPLAFYFFTLPAWRLIAGWLTTLAFVIFVASIFFAAIAGGARVLDRRPQPAGALPLRGVSATFAFVLLTLAFRVYLARFDRIYEDHTVFAGVTYTDAHITITGLLIVAIALVAGAVIAAINALLKPRLTWLVAALVPAAPIYFVVGVIGWQINSFVVKPNELVRESPFIANNIEMTRRAYGLDRMAQVQFPAETGLPALDAANNRDTLENIRLWDWRALQDTLRQLQEIRTYYDFPDVDIDRYEIDGQIRQMMLAVRELNVDRLPESSRNWINEKLIYTHGYGITMNPVNGFTPEGLPALILRDMPVQSTVPSLTVSRPEMYFGELTNTDVYVRTRQKEFNYPQGETNSVTTYEGGGGIVLGGFFRRLLIALDRGDITKLPFSDDVTSESRLLMRRNIRERVSTLAPFLLFDEDPYIVIGDGGRLFWMMDGFTAADTYPYSRHYQFGQTPLNYLRNSVKVVVDAYDGTTTFYEFDPTDPVIAAYRTIFPSLFKDGSDMPPTLRKHVRYPELLLEMQAAVYGLYHMTDAAVFYNKEDLWSVASEVSSNGQREQAAVPMEPNFVLMRLPGEGSTEFVEILPFTPANRNNLIGWIAGRSDEPNYGSAIVYNFPKTRLVDGPLQIEARIDQNAQLSGQLSLWNQQGSNVHRGKPDRDSCRPRAALCGADLSAGGAQSDAGTPRRCSRASGSARLRSDIRGGACRVVRQRAVYAFSGGKPRACGARADRRDRCVSGDPRCATGHQQADQRRRCGFGGYQRLTAEGRLGEAGLRLEGLKQKLEELNRRR